MSDRGRSSDAESPDCYGLVVNRRWSRSAITAATLLIGLATVTAGVAVPILLLWRVDGRALGRWSQIGQAVEPIGVFFSGVAFIGIALTLLLQRRELHHQREELTITQEEQQRSSEIALRQLHMDLVKMAIDDRELRQVWPPLVPGMADTKKDHYCNLILYLQKVAYETHTIELAELRGVLRYLMAGGDMYRYWEKARALRGVITTGDEAEDFFTAEVDRAFVAATRPGRSTVTSELRNALIGWIRGSRGHRR